MGKIADKIAAQNAPKPTMPNPKGATANRIKTQNAWNVASNGSQNTAKESTAKESTATKKPVTTIEQYNKLAKQRKEERTVKLKDTLMVRNAAIINASAKGQDLVDGINNWTVWSETLTQAQQTNPELYQQYLDASNQDSSLALINLMSGKFAEMTNYAKAINDSYLKQSEDNAANKVSWRDLYNDIVNNSEITASGEKVTETERKMEDLQITYDQIEADIRSQYDWKASEGYIMALVTKQQKDIIPQFRKLESQYRKDKLDHNSLLQNAQVEFQFAQEDARYEEQRKEDLLMTRYKMDMQTFESQKEMVTMGMDFAMKEYFSNKQFEDQVELMWVQEQFRKEAFAWELAESAKYASKEIKTTTVKIGEWVSEELLILDEQGNILNRYKPSANTTPTVEWSGNYYKDYNTGQTFDEVALPSFQAAYAELEASWFTDTMVFAKAHRDQAETIASMAKKQWIPYDASNPNKTAAALRGAWHQVADVGHSQHEKWLAIDIYSDSKLSAPTEAQVNIMKKNWWIQNGWPNDRGHFEYVGVKEIDTNTQTILDTVNYLRYESWRIQAGYTFGKGIAFTQSADYASKFKYLRDNLTLDKLISAKASWATFGALSNEELRMLSNAASSLRLTTTQEQYDSELNRIEQVLRWYSTPSKLWMWTPVPSTPTLLEYGMEAYFQTTNVWKYYNILDTLTSIK